jgi:hypothetical protein
MQTETTTNVNEFLELPYGDRQLVSFVPDAEVSSSPSKQPDWEGSVKKVKPSPKTAANVIADVGFSLLVPHALPASIVADYLVKQIVKAKNAKISKIHLLPKSWAKLLILPPGHPRPGVVFAGHPAEPKNYVPIADFHRYAFEHKFSEILSILMHLGAQKIEVRHLRGWGQDFSERLSVGIPRVAVGLNAGSSRNEQSTLLYEAELDGGQCVSLPTNLVWLPHESTWKQIVEGRTKFGLKTFSLNLQYQEDYGVNLGLKAEIEAAHLEVGGEFERHMSTTWEIRGTFGPSTL